MQQLRREAHYLIELLLKLLVALLVFSLMRMLFISFNQHLFPDTTGLQLTNIFLQGLRFDMVAVTYINLPVIISYLLPIPIRSSRGYPIFQLILFLFCNGLALLLEFADMAYFPYTLKRTNAGDLGLITNTTDLLPNLLKEHWYLIFLYLGMLFILGYFAYQWRLRSKPAPFRLVPQLFALLLGAALTLVAVRGGIQLRPLMPLNANQCVDNIQLAPLVYPSSLSMLFSAQQRFLKPKNYFDEAELLQIIPGPRTYGEGPMKKDNICIIVLESFGKEYSQLFNGTKGYTPFLDSLTREGFYCEHSFANGLRSTQGIAAIAAGLPALMDDPIMFSAYQSNQLQGIASLLKPKGYTSGFFHGSNPGSMEFEDFARLCGFEHFYDKTAYPDKSDYDGNWGIWDLPFFQFTANTLDTYQSPFVNLLFSLTSHHPYEVEDFYKEKFPDLPPLYRSVSYTDMALSKFFDTASQMDWFNNTLFVITADHTGQSKLPVYRTHTGKYKVPILFYHPKVKLNGDSKGLAQQIDILPTILDYLHYDEPIRTFGQSLLSPPEINYAYSYSNQIYQVIDPKFVLLFDGEKSLALYNHIEDPMLSKNILIERERDAQRLEWHLKAIIQRHHEGMVNNRLSQY